MTPHAHTTLQQGNANPAQATRHQTGLCDFCGDPLGRRWINFLCRDFDRVYTGQTSSTLLALQGHWAACPACAPVVSARAWRRLARRVIRRYLRQRHDLTSLDLAVVRDEMAAMWHALEHHLTGETEPGGVA